MPAFKFKGTGTTKVKKSGRRTKGLHVVKLARTKLRKVINTQIQKSAEKKMSTSSDELGIVAYTNISQLQFDIIPISPYGSSGVTISQGDEQGMRNGNRIRTHSCWVRGVIFPAAYDAVSNVIPKPQEVRVWFFSLKQTNTQPTSLPNFFQTGNAATSPNGTILDMTRTINTDVYIYRGHRSFKVGNADYTFSTTPNSVQQQRFTNNDFKYNCKFNINVTNMIPKQITYNDADTTPFSKSVFMYWESVNADGSTQTSGNIPTMLYYTTTYTYTDI